MCFKYINISYKKSRSKKVKKMCNMCFFWVIFFYFFQFFFIFINRNFLTPRVYTQGVIPLHPLGFSVEKKDVSSGINHFSISSQLELQKKKNKNRNDGENQTDREEEYWW